MKIKRVSSFKDHPLAEQYFLQWVSRLCELNGSVYKRISLDTSLGKTIVWGINTERTDVPSIVIFPGFRTCGLFWDIDNALEPIKKNYRVFLVDTNGQPCLSEGNTPDIKGDGYGMWAAEVLKKLSPGKAIIAGASFGALICLKLCRVAPAMVEKAILLNPGSLQPFSLSLKNLYYNFLPLMVPTRKNVEAFLDKAIFYRNKHTVSPEGKSLLLEYELFAIKQFNDKTQKPYAMKKEELEAVKTEIYLLVGDKDILFPYKRSVKIAKRYLVNLKEVHVFPGTGHGIETSKTAMQVISRIAGNKSYSCLTGMSVIQKPALGSGSGGMNL